MESTIEQYSAKMIDYLPNSNFNHAKFIKDSVKDFIHLKIIKCACDYFNVTNEEIKSKSRQRPIVLARQVAQYFIFEMCPKGKFNKTYIGSLFGQDHSTVINSLQTIQDQIDVDKKFASTIIDLRNIINSKL